MHFQDDARRIAGLEGYLITRDGNVISERRNYKKRSPILVGGFDKDGYKRYVLMANGGKRVYVRRCVLVCTAFHGPRPSNMQVRHLDGSRDNDNASNLIWGTPKENSADMVRHKTRRYGKQISLTVLTEAEVKLIKSMDHVPRRLLVDKFKVSSSCIDKIRNGTTWKYVK